MEESELKFGSNSLGLDESNTPTCKNILVLTYYGRMISQSMNLFIPLQKIHQHAQSYAHNNTY